MISIADEHVEKAVAEVNALIAAIHPLLKGHDHKIQGMALGQLAATWVAGHFVVGSEKKTGKLRKDLVRRHASFVNYLIEQDGYERS